MSWFTAYGGKKDKTKPSNKTNGTKWKGLAFLVPASVFLSGKKKNTHISLLLKHIIVWSLKKTMQPVKCLPHAGYFSHNHKPDEGVFSHVHVGMPCSVRFSTANQANHTLESSSISVCLTHARRSCLLISFSWHLSLPHLCASQIANEHIRGVVSP